MGKLKTLGLMCFSIFIFSCANVNNISPPNNNVKPESVIDKAKRAVVLLSSSISEETITDENQSAACSGVVIDKEGHILTNFHYISNMFIKINESKRMLIQIHYISLVFNTI